MAEQTYNVVGQSVKRRDGLGHVTGKTVYIDDISFPDMLHLKMVRSPVAHAKLKGIDFSQAEKVPGFVRALTHEDVPKNIYTILCLIGVGPDEEPVLAVDKVLFKGEPIAAIIAETEEAAMEAVSKVRLDLEELPPVLDVEEALQPGAPILKDWGTNHFIYDYEHGQQNPCRKVRLGDVEKAFEEADFIVEGRYQSSPIEHAPTETTGCIAKPEPDGRYTVYTNTQALFFTLDNTALILQIPFQKLHFVGGTVGGGFGGKVDVITEPIATLAAMKTGRPVKYVYTREEEMRVSSTRSAWRMYYKDGVMKDGRIIARQVTTVRRCGRVQPPHPLRGDQACGQRSWPLQHPECLHRRLLRLHQPHPGQRDARLRGHVRFVRHRGADGQDRRDGRPRPVVDPLRQRLPRRRHQAAQARWWRTPRSSKSCRQRRRWSATSCPTNTRS
jgi:CO/xanthine dehydrogenase Mo-binding subunit